MPLSVPFGGEETICTLAGSMAPNTATSLLVMLMVTDTALSVVALSSRAIGAKMLSTGVGVIAIGPGSAGQFPVAHGRRVASPLNLPSAGSTNENIRLLALPSRLAVKTPST